jgi:predicted dehydrogenase
MPRIGIVGMGGMGWFHASRYFQIPGAELVAIADIRPERLEAKNAVQINIENQASPPDVSALVRYAEGSRLIEDADVDIVDICLPSFLHAEYTIKALRAGRHVLCEKPMALNVQDANAMLEAARQADRKLMIAQCIRFWPEYRFLRQTMQAGTLGKLLSLHMQRVGGRPNGWGWQDWFLDPARSGGALYDLHIHDVDFVNSLLGAPDEVQASGRRAAPGSVCEVVHAIYRYRGGPQVSIYGGWSAVQIPFRAGYEAWFEKGFLHYDGSRSPTLVTYDDPDQKNEQPAKLPPGDAYFNELQYFIQCVQNNQDPAECPPESARDSLLLLHNERTIIDREEGK